MINLPLVAKFSPTIFSPPKNLSFSENPRHRFSLLSLLYLSFMNLWWSKLSDYLPNFGDISSKLLLGSTGNRRMSTQDRRAQPIRYTRNHSRRKTVLYVDLNVAPPSDNRDQEGTSSHVPGDVPPVQRGSSSTPAPIDVEALDDDVIIISSPRELAEVQNSCMRTRGQVILVDEDSDDRLLKSNNRNKRKRVPTNQSTIMGDVYINLEANSSLKEGAAQSAIPPKPIEPTFSCPICMGNLVEEMSTICGHIFCKICIKASIAAQGKCPTCRRKITIKDTIRVYLPATR
ncbi:E3 ubiquitin-protein ligase RNF4 isoform X1 [Capsicum chacoense]